MKKIFKPVVCLALAAALLLSVSSAVLADSFVTTSAGDKVVYFTVKVDKSQKALPEKWPDASYDTKNLSDVEVVLKLPSNYSETGAPIPVIMYAEGYGQYITDSHGQGSWAQQFTKAGYAVFEVDNIENMNGAVKDLGAPAKIRAAMKAFDYIRENYNVQDKLIPIGVSYGSYMALEIIDWYPEYVSCAVIGGPNVSLKADHPACDNYGSGINSMANYYNFSNKNNYYKDSSKKELNQGVYDTAVANKYDYYGNIYTKDGVKYLDKDIPPVLFSTGATEPAAAHARALAVAEALKNSGNTVVLKEYAGTGHGEVCSLSRADINKDVLDFISTYKDFNCKHTNVAISPAVKATCIQKGYSEGKYCADCGKIIVAPKEYPMTEHIAGPEPTCSTPQTCTICGTTLKAQTYKHTYSGEWIKDGDKEYRKCDSCTNKEYRKLGEDSTASSTVNGQNSVNSSTENSDNTNTNANLNSSNSNDNNSTSSTALIVAIAIGAGVALILLAVLCYFLLWRKKPENK